MRGAVSSAQTRLYTNRLKAADELGNWEEWRELGEQIRQHTLENLDYYLIQLVKMYQKRRTRVLCEDERGSCKVYSRRCQKETSEKSSKIKVDGNRRN